MTRFQFILAFALFAATATLAFVVTFHDRQLAADSPKMPTSSRASFQSAQRTPPALIPLPQRTPQAFDPTQYEVTAPTLEEEPLAQAIQEDARKQLDDLTKKFVLTPNQRRSVFPLLVNHHPDFRENLVINGSSSRPPSSAQLATEIFPLLDPLQQEAFQEDLLADQQWWGEIIAQLREDLDQAVESGEVQVTNEPARSDGTSIENDGINFDDFFND